jgi:uncharacterized membrane protein
MLGAGRYLLGAAELVALIGFAWLGASQLRKSLAPRFQGSPAFLAAAILAIAILLWTAEILGTFGFFKAVPYLLLVVLAGVAIGLFRGWRGGGVIRAARRLLRAGPEPSARNIPVPEAARSASGAPHPHDRTRGRAPDLPALIALAIAVIAVIHFAAGVKQRLSTGMTGFDSTWYHGPFAAGFFQGGDTWGLHFIAPQFLAWFYPANSEVLHAVGMLAFSRDLLSPLLNLGWFIGCLAAAWCVGRPYRAAPYSLALGAIALSVPALSDQAGEARNDIVGIFFLLAAVAVAVNAWALRDDEEGLPLGAVAVVGLAAGLAAGTKLNFLLPGAVLVVGPAVIAAHGRRWKTLAVAALAAVAGGGYWYLRNLAHAGNPLPWVKHLGPITLPAPGQALGGREGHGVLGYLTDSSIWSDWFLPGLHHGFSVFWPLLSALALAGLLLCLSRRADPVLRLAGAVGLAAALAWLIAPTSASGPDGIPHGFESGLRYLSPALVLGLALLPAVPGLRRRLTRLLAVMSRFPPQGSGNRDRNEKTDRGPAGSRFFPHVGSKRDIGLAGGALVLLVVLAGYPIQRHYLRDRYADPSFTTPGLNAAFKWSRDISDARIATTSTRQYPLFGADLSNRVTYVGEERPHGGFTPPTTCRRWRELINAGDYDYVVASRDRIEPGKPLYPPAAAWTADPKAKVILRKPPTVVYQLRTPLNPSKCSS